jgi:flagellar basal-body rod modification protein FlgD
MVNNVGKTVPGAASGSQMKSDKFALKTEDFIQMMITQLQNQDPMEPAKNEELLAQMSQISQLESSTQLQKSLKTLVQQNNLSSAGSMIGKLVTGKDAAGEDLEGIVTSVKVVDGEMFLELDSGQKMGFDDVTSVTSAATVGQAPAGA